MLFDTSGWTEKKLQIVEATITLVAEEGFLRTPTSRIAKEAKVAEGTIFRHFHNKDDLINTAAQLALAKITAAMTENYRPEAPVHTQYIDFCRYFLLSGQHWREHMYCHHYKNSPQGVAYRQGLAIAIKSNIDVKPLLFPLNAIILEGQKLQILRDYPVTLIYSLTLGPLAFTLEDAHVGLIELNNNLIENVAKSCWDAIRR